MSEQQAFEMTKSGEIVAFTFELEDIKNEDFGDYVHRLGFDRNEYLIGDPDGDHLAWHHRKTGEGHEYVAFWWDVNNVRTIFVPDWPTLVKLQALVAPIIQAMVLTHQLDELYELARKAFRAGHGHDYVFACRRCDPDALKRSSTPAGP